MNVANQLSKYKVIALIYETYHIIPPGEEIPYSLFTVEGIEGLVKDKSISREVASLIYNIMIAEGEDE